MSDGDSAGLGAPQPGAGRGVLPSQALAQAIEREWVSSGEYRIRPEAIQPASIDLRLGDVAWALRCSFLPDVDSTVEEKMEGLAFQRIDLRDGAVLERDRPYLVPLIEELALPGDVRAKANPKSSTGRLDVFTRVITDRHHRFDDIRAGYRGRLYLEVVPRSFAIQVKTGLSLNQLRLARGDVRLGDEEIRALQAEAALVYAGSEPVPEPELAVADGLFLSLDVSGDADRVVGYRAKKNSLPVDLGKVRAYQLARLLGPGLSRGRREDRARAGDLLPAALGRGGQHPAADRRRDDGLRPDRRRAAHPLRRLLRPRLRFRPGRQPARQPRRARGPRPRRPLHGRAPTAGLQGSAWSGWRRRRSASTAPTSGPTTRAR